MLLTCACADRCSDRKQINCIAAARCSEGSTSGCSLPRQGVTFDFTATTHLRSSISSHVPSTALCRLASTLSTLFLLIQHLAFQVPFLSLSLSLPLSNSRISAQTATALSIHQPSRQTPALQQDLLRTQHNAITRCSLATSVLLCIDLASPNSALHKQAAAAAAAAASHTTVCGTVAGASSVSVTPTHTYTHQHTPTHTRTITAPPAPPPTNAAATLCISKRSVACL